MQKPKQYDWKDSNLALFGSDTEKKVTFLLLSFEFQIHVWFKSGSLFLSPAKLSTWKVLKRKVRGQLITAHNVNHRNSDYVRNISFALVNGCGGFVLGLFQVSARDVCFDHMTKNSSVLETALFQRVAIGQKQLSWEILGCCLSYRIVVYCVMLKTLRCLKRLLFSRKAICQNRGSYLASQLYYIGLVDVVFNRIVHSCWT